jgi:hypothetical protein
MLIHTKPQEEGICLLQRWTALQVEVGEVQAQIETLATLQISGALTCLSVALTYQEPRTTEGLKTNTDLVKLREGILTTDQTRKLEDLQTTTRGLK